MLLSLLSLSLFLTAAALPNPQDAVRPGDDEGSGPNQTQDGKTRNVDVSKLPILDRRGKGKQEIFQACKQDDECVSGCCEFTKNLCRVFSGLTGSERCKDGRALNFDGDDGVVINFDTKKIIGRISDRPTKLDSNANSIRPGDDEGSGPNQTQDGKTRNIDLSKLPLMDKPGTGNILALLPCQRDSECGSGCCEFSSNICRTLVRLSGSQRCKDGRAPNFEIQGGVVWNFETKQVIGRLKA